jgi:Ca2+-transporting ATPase
MYFLLFMIGMEIDLIKLKKCSFFIFKSTFFILALAAAAGTLVVHYAFDANWFISLIVSLSFATVGEALLLPILDEFKIINTKLGQSIIGIGTLDDIIELVTLAVVVYLVGSVTSVHFSSSVVLIFLAVLFVFSFGIKWLKHERGQFVLLPIEALFLFTLFILFLFIGVGQYAEAGAIGALLAGLAIRTFIPERRLQLIESEVKTMSYGFFAPLFFLWVGASMDMSYLVGSPDLTLLVIVVAGGIKIVGSYLSARRELGFRQSLLLGVGLSVRFSTSIIIIKILFDNSLIDSQLYSVIIASSVIFTLFIPLIFSRLLHSWRIDVSN